MANEEGQGGAGEGQPQGGGSGTPPEGGTPGQGSDGQKQSQFVPYERFQEVNTRYKDLEGKYAQMQGVLDQMKGALSPESKKQAFKLDYSNPEKSMEEHFNRMLDERFNSLKAENESSANEAKKSAAIKWFREQDGYTPEMEDKAAIFIKENGLVSMDPAAAVKLAHKFLTMGEGSGYTRSVKEGLKKPGSGSREKESDVKAEMAKLDPRDEKFEEKMKALHAKLVGAA